MNAGQMAVLGVMERTQDVHAAGNDIRNRLTPGSIARRAPSEDTKLQRMDIL